MKKYIPKEIESSWQKKWKEGGIYKAEGRESKKDKFYVLDMFPYPSGDGLHVGHFKGYTATDVISRFLRAKGYNVLHPMGWDAFGLPAENYAIKTGIHPKNTTAKNIAHIRDQMKLAGLSYDWEREIDTTDPQYYKWTQWIFLQLYKKGLAYEAEAPINWCPKDKTGLANEEVVNGCCDRCGTPVVRKKIRQWILGISKYADRLLDGLKGLDWPESIKEMQRNWIGRSEGAVIKFTVDPSNSLRASSLQKNKKSVNREPITDNSIEVFTTRADTLFGVTYVVLAPEHKLVSQITTPEQKKEVEAYVKKTAEKTDLQRTALEKEKTGAFTGAFAINPINGEQIPVWIADYVLESYGTGAIMAVPAHDERDFEFAKKFDLPIIEVVVPKNEQKPEKGNAYVAYGVLKNSGEYSGLTSEEAKSKITQDLNTKGFGEKKVNYKLRDWIFSRQRYWGEPIPIIFCRKCWENSKLKTGNSKQETKEEFTVIDGVEYAVIPVPEKDLPIILPEVEKYQPTGTGESPLASMTDWVNTKCPNCGGKAKRETNTMPQWAGSCWYYLRFIDPKNEKELVDKGLEKYWMGKGVKNKIGGVDWYVGGAEHAVLHLLYARFWHKFLFDIEAVSTNEPFYKLRNVGLIMGSDGQKMSKSRGNVISPEEMVNSYGADTLRLFEMFIGPFGDVADWKPTAVEGVYRFLQRVWLMSFNIIESKKDKSLPEAEREINRTIKKIEEDIWEMKFNTSVSSMMEFVNFANRFPDKVGTDSLGKFLQVLAPFAPHMTEELWQELQGKVTKVTKEPKEPKEKSSGSSGSSVTFDSIHSQSWPVWDEKLIESEMVTVVVQVNGKLRGQLQTERGASQEEVEKKAREIPKVAEYLAGKDPKKVIFVQDRLINFVV